MPELILSEVEKDVEEMYVSIDQFIDTYKNMSYKEFCNSYYGMSADEVDLLIHEYQEDLIQNGEI